MSQIQCDACTDLRDYAKEFVAHGVTEKVAGSLGENTGLNPDLTVLHEDCEDMADVVDCLVGRMTEVDQYSNCDWKEYAGKLVPNLYEVFKAINAVDCGQWEKLKMLDEMMELLRQILAKLEECCDGGGDQPTGCIDTATPLQYGDACPPAFWNSHEGQDPFLDGGVATRTVPEECLIYLTSAGSSLLYRHHGTDVTEVFGHSYGSFTVTFPTPTTMHMVNTNTEYGWGVLYLTFGE